jgi:DNA polymerase-1
VASPGNKLVVADYGQLELRVLAHMTNCKAMIEAFNLGGDFHSRTAMVSPFLKNKSMYPEIKK